MKKLIPFIALLVTVNAHSAAFDLKATMKEMRIEFKQAAEAQNIDEMETSITHLTELVNQAQQGAYPLEKQDLYLEGFNKLTIALANVKANLEAGELDQAKAALRYS